METLSFQATPEMKNRLEAYAKQLDRSKGYLIRQALAEYFEDLGDYMIALKRLKKPGKTLSSKQVLARLNAKSGNKSAKK